jgi:aspartate/methionine/tyrosine aminotransferase
MVSRRAQQLTANPPPIAVAHFQAEARPYDPVRDPDGYLNLGTAENRLLWDVLEPRLAGPRPVQASDIRYALAYGTAGFRAAVAGFLSRSRAVPVAADDLVVVSGATAALDIAASALCDPGDFIVVPAPYYSAFDTDLCGRSGCRLLDPEAIARTVRSARRDGAVVRALAFTSPYNPVGHVYRPDELRALLAVAAELDLDVIADELYAHSTLDGHTFTGLLDVAGDGSERIHTVWGFAKDLGLPGLKAGVLHTLDPRVRSVARELAYFAPLSSDTQALLEWLLTDVEWTGRLLDCSRVRLQRSYAHVSHRLRTHGIPHIPAAAGFSVWADLRAGLAEPSFAAEDSLRADLFDRARVNILPGAIFGSPEPGWFRICHTTEPAIVSEAVERIAAVVSSAGRGRR